VVQISASEFNGGTVLIQLQHLPDTCPICHRAVTAKLLGHALWKTETRTVQVLLQCASRACQSAFIANYTGQLTQGLSNPPWQLQSTAPSSPLPIDVPENVAKISPNFVNIRNQVAAAESGGLDQLVGIGLRKALEFLIKDFAILENPTEEEKIKKEWLATCIDLYVPDSNVQKCAKRAAWLGNDETHYLRKWETKDIKDLKILVTLTVNWIHNHLETKRFEGDMPDKKS
jgi:hypothetical protein